MFATTENTIRAPGPKGSLKGTIAGPIGPDSPVVLVVPGSGPVDRDGNGAAGLRTSMYRLLAEGLATHGIASVRIDKRGLYGSRAAIDDPNAVTLHDYASDVRTWISVIKSRTGASCVWVLGHSEGGLVALLAAQDTPGICGLVLVATPGRPLNLVLREQLRANPANAPILEQAEAEISRLEAGRHVDVTGLHPELLPLFHPGIQDFLISTFSVHPAGLIAACRLPIVIVQGRRDIQVGEKDAEQLAQANTGATLALLPDTNHVLKPVTTDDRAANVATYSNPNLPLAAGVTEVIAKFVLESRQVR